MDATFFLALEFDAISEVIISIEPSLKVILMQLESRDPEDVINEVLKNSDLNQMRNARMSAIRAAMDKVDHCLGQVAMLKSQDKENATPEYEVIRKAEDMYKNLVPQDMISRRCMKNMTNDFMELLYFIAGKRVSFPIAIINTFPNIPVDDSISKSALHFPFEYAKDSDTSREEDEHEQDNGYYYHNKHDTDPPIFTEKDDMGTGVNTGDNGGSEKDDSSSTDECIRTHDRDIYVNIMNDIRNFLDVEDQSKECNMYNSVAMDTRPEYPAPSTEPPRATSDVTTYKPPEALASQHTPPTPHNGVPATDVNESNLNEPCGKESESPIVDPCVSSDASQAPQAIIANSPHTRGHSTKSTPMSVTIEATPHQEVITSSDSITSTVDLIDAASSSHYSSCYSACFRTSLLKATRLVDRETHVTEKSIELEMAEGKTGGGWERWSRSRKRENPKADDRCDGCADQLDSLERHLKRAEEAEESSIEVMRNMCIQFDELSDELRRVKRVMPSPSS